MRIDKYIQDKFNLKSRTYAENLIKTGSVLLRGKVVTKSSLDVGENDDIEIVNDENYASQGAYKLEKAFDDFSLDVNGKNCADIGCSNGGFTDCLLRHGAKHVLAVDVADCALDSKLLESGKVDFLKANARELPKILEKVDFLCSDVSFISLKYVLQSMFDLLKNGGEAVVLVKPQFELDKSALTKSGIVTDEKLRKRAVESVKSYAISVGFEILDLSISPIRYENKNVEYLLYLKKPFCC
ncbi:hemolysin TlyA family protein [Firmicutes bacterium CAG:475]|nr:hemolysin TlyA family protein [Firmicutes bacterium CAG:475]